MQVSDWRTGRVLNGGPGPVVSLQPWPDPAVRYGAQVRLARPVLFVLLAALPEACLTRLGVAVLLLQSRHLRAQQAEPAEDDEEAGDDDDFAAPVGDMYDEQGTLVARAEGFAELRLVSPGTAVPLPALRLVSSQLSASMCSQGRSVHMCWLQLQTTHLLRQPLSQLQMPARATLRQQQQAALPVQQQHPPGLARTKPRRAAAAWASGCSAVCRQATAASRLLRLPSRSSSSSSSSSNSSSSPLPRRPQHQTGTCLARSVAAAPAPHTARQTSESVLSCSRLAGLP